MPPSRRVDFYGHKAILPVDLKELYLGKYRFRGLYFRPMDFTEIVKQALLPQLIARGFAVAQESKGRISFASGDFEVHCAYDYARSKDFYLRVCCTTVKDIEKCLEDHELVQRLSYPGQAYQALSEAEQMQKYARYYSDFFRDKGEILFNKKLFTAL